MKNDSTIYEDEMDSDLPDPDEAPLSDRKVVTQLYDIVVASLLDQIEEKTIHLRPLSERPDFQRRYVWSDKLASRLIESILLRVPIPPCYLSQNEAFELDVIDGQQRLFSIYRYIENQFKLSGLEIFKEFNKLYFHQLPTKIQRQIKTHTLRCTVITNESHPEVKFDVFERLNTNTVPLNSQELRNCIYRGNLNSMLKDAVSFEPWLSILGRTKPDKRMRDEELALRFFAFHIYGVDSYKTPQKHWLNSLAKSGMNYSVQDTKNLYEAWERAIRNCLIWFPAKSCFRRPESSSINRALFDLIMNTAEKVDAEKATKIRSGIRNQFKKVLRNDEFKDLIGRAVDHTSRTRRRFEVWQSAIEDLII